MKTIKNLTAEQIRKSILQLAIQGKLVKQDLNDEPASELVKRIYEEKQRLIKEGKLKKDKNESYIYKGDDNCYYEKVGKEVRNINDEIPFEIPNSWCWIRLGHSIRIFDKSPFKASYGKQVGKYPFFTSSELLKYKCDKAIFKHGITMGTGGKGSVNLVIGEFSTSTDCLNFDSIIYLLEYLFIFLKANIDVISKTMFKGVGLKHLQKNDLFNLLLPLPPLDEQERIVRKFESYEPLLSQYELIERNITILESSFEEKLKASILQYAIEGKLVKQDPNDEPASKLLERIKSEKEMLIREGKIKRDKNESEIIIGDDKNYYEKLELTLKDVCSYGNTCIKQPKSIFELSLIELDQIISGDSTCPVGVSIKENKITSSRTYFEKGMILYSKLRPYLDKVILADKNGICSSELVPFWSYIPVNWLLLYLHSPLFIQRVNGDSFGVKMPRVKTSTFLNSKINLFSEAKMLKTIIKVRKLFCLF